MAKQPTYKRGQKPTVTVQQPGENDTPGRSKFINLPKRICESQGIHKGTVLDIWEEGDRIVLRKQSEEDSAKPEPCSAAKRINALDRIEPCPDYVPKEPLPQTLYRTEEGKIEHIDPFKEEPVLSRYDAAPNGDEGK